MSAERMHPEDLRALCAASILADPNTNPAGAVRLADTLLRHLADNPITDEAEYDPSKPPF